MGIRISTSQTVTGSRLKVDGTLTAAGLPALESTVATLERPLTVDLSELVASDENGIQALRDLRETGAELVGLSPVMALRIGAGGEERGPQPAAQPGGVQETRARKATRRGR